MKTANFFAVVDRAQTQVRDASDPLARCNQLDPLDTASPFSLTR